MNADNRLIASSVLKKISAKIEPWVSSNQRGFIKGRSMLQNIIEIDEAAMRISLRHPHGALVLFDFEAAFPSLAHSYLWEALNALGLPGPLINAIKCFYFNNMRDSTEVSFVAVAFRSGC